MRGLTQEEADILRNATAPSDPDWVDDEGTEAYDDQEMAVIHRLRARRLLVQRWLVGEVYSAAYEEITPLGRIALACHAAVSVGRVGV